MAESTGNYRPRVGKPPFSLWHGPARACGPVAASWHRRDGGDALPPASLGGRCDVAAGATPPRRGELDRAPEALGDPQPLLARLAPCGRVRPPRGAPEERADAARAARDARDRAPTREAERAPLATRARGARTGPVRPRHDQHPRGDLRRELPVRCRDGARQPGPRHLGRPPHPPPGARVLPVDRETLGQGHAARARDLQPSQKLAAREARRQAAIRDAGAEARSLAGVRAERSAYVDRLSAQTAVDAQQLARLEAQAQAAEAKAHQLTQAPPAAALALPVHTRSTQATGETVTLVSTGYCLTGTTATGLPVGWGVAAVDPSVIPLGTHLSIPGYGAAVAADTGGSVVGDRIDLWFPTCAQASGWGTRSVTIALH